jgi:hypothetical protein
MGKKNPPEVRMQYELEGEGDGETVVLSVDINRKGKWVRVAKRYPGQNWINLEPGYTVRGSEPGTDYGGIEIEYTPANAMPQ